VSGSHRLFFALMPGAAVRAEVAAVQQRLGVSGRPVKSANFHVTLAFLGMQRAALIPHILDVAAALRFEPCRVAIDQVGTFARAGVLWLGVSEPPQVLLHFQQALTDGLQTAGIGHDPKPWTFHLTLYRRLRKPFPNMAPVAIEWALDGFDLVESVGARTGVEYHSIGHWNGRA
jgi:2'-5' RNA ligase